MAPYTNIPLSPAELSYLHTSLSTSPPIRPDGRSPTDFRPLVAESEILPSANGSARVCFADGTEAVVGVKAEVERTGRRVGEAGVRGEGLGKGKGGDVEMGGADEDGRGRGRGRDEWLEVAIDIPGMRDDDALPVFLGAMLNEALLADGELRERLWINNRFHWRLYVDVSELHPDDCEERGGDFDAETDCSLGATAVTTTLIPSSPTESYHSSGSAQHSPTITCLSGRRRSAFQRRLGSFNTAISEVVQLQTAGHAACDGSGREHPLRSLYL